MCTSIIIIIIIIIIMYYGKLSKFAKVLENARFPGSLAEDRISWTKNASLLWLCELTQLNSLSSTNKFC